MKIRLCSIFFSIVLLWTTVAMTAPPLEQVNSLIEDDAFVVAHVDIQSFDFDTAMETVASLYDNPTEMKEPQSEVREAIQSMRKHDARSLFFVWTIQDLSSSPYLLVTVDQPQKNTATIAKALGRLGPHALIGDPQTSQCKTVGKVLVYGQKKTIDRVSQSDAKLSDSRAAIIKAAWAETADAGLQLAIVPTDDVRRAVSQMLPPAEGASKFAAMMRLLNATRYAGLGVGTKNGPHLQCVVQAESDQAASEIFDTANVMLDLGAKQAVQRMSPELLPQLVEIRKMLAPRRQGTKLNLVVSPQEIKTIQKVVSRPLSAVASRVETMNSLRWLSLAMLNFESKWGAYPPHASYDDNGKPLLSWRVYVLPYLEESELYERFHLDEPWDSEHNRKLIAEIPDVFRNRSKDVPKGKTTLLVPHGKKTVFAGTEGTTLRSIADGTSRTILLVDAAPEHAVTWTQPADWDVDFSNPFKGVLGERKEFAVARCDGSAHMVKKSETKDEKMTAMLTKNGGEVFEE